MYYLIGAKGHSLGAGVLQYFVKSGKPVAPLDIEDFDATNFSATENFFKSAETPQGVCVFVGKMKNAFLPDETEEDLLDMFRVNVLSLFVVAKVLYPIFKEQGYGRLVHIGSNAAVQGFSGMLSYCTSKFATRGMIQVIAKEYAKIGATANQINPCAFEPRSSNMSNAQVRQFMEVNSLGGDDIIKMMVSRIPMKRLATVEDLYNLVRFLLFDSSFITGQSINLSGGMVM